MQSFKEEPSYTEVNPGDNTELRCVVKDIGGECRWQKDGKVCLFSFFFSLTTYLLKKIIIPMLVTRL